MKGMDNPPELRGIIPNSFQHVFDAIDASEDSDFLVRASFLEIYNEEIRDLLGKNSQARLEVKESVDAGVYVKDLTSFVVKGLAEISNVLRVGDKNRTVGATLMNQVRAAHQRPRGSLARERASAAPRWRDWPGQLSRRELTHACARAHTHAHPHACVQDSSRSHSIFTITIERSGHGSADGGHIRVGKLNLVDLAGSERQSKTGATGER